MKWQVEDISVHCNILENKQGTNINDQEPIGVGLPRALATGIVDKHNASLDKLQAIIDEFAKGISFYGDEENWGASQNLKLFNRMETVDKSHVLDKQISGIQARAIKSRHPEIFKGK